MSCTYLIVRSRHGAADARRRIEWARRYLPIVTEVESVHEFPDGTVCAAFSAAVECANGSYTHTSARGAFVVFNGWVAGIKPAPYLASSSVAEQLAAHISEKPWDEFVDAATGEWSLISVNDQGELRAATDFLAGEHLYHGVKDGVVVLSNRAILCAAALHEAIPTPNPWFLGWLLTRSQAFISHDETPFENVHTLHPRTTLSISAGSYTTNIHKRPSRQGIPLLSWDELAEELTERVRIIERLSTIPFRLSLTGGRDSRLVLAGLLAAKSAQKLRSCYLIAEPTHPDAVVGQLLAKQFGLSFECMPKQISKIDLWDDLANHNFGTEFGVQYWDSKGLASQPREGRVGGMYGEIYRSHAFVRQFLGWAGVSWAFEDDWFVNPNGLMTSQGRAYYQERLRKYWQNLRNEGLTPLQARDRWHRDARMWRWVGQARLAVGLGFLHVNPIPSPRLLDKYLSLSVYDQRIGRVHYELMKRCAPGLAEHPYATAGFSMLLTGHREKRMHFPAHTRPPLAQRVLWQKYRKDIDAYLLAPSSPSFFEIIDRKKLERLLQGISANGTPQEINIVLGLLGVRHAMQEPIQARPCRIDA